MSELEQTQIAILGEEVVATLDQRSIDSLQFLPDNPRVYAAVRDLPGFEQLSDEEQQLKIFEQLQKEPSVKNLRPQIEKDGGLQEPILVRHDTSQVIEGNSRLAIYRQLHREHPQEERWQTIRCLVVSKLSPAQQIRVLGQAHLHGKTDWTPYAKALFCYRWVREDKNEPKELHEFSGLSVHFINKQVAVVELMIENQDDMEKRYSHYNVALTNQKISSVIKSKDNKQLRKVILSGIKNEEFTAQELRDWLPVVLQKQKVAKKFASGSITLKDAHDRAEVTETKNRFDRILGLLDAIETREISNLDFAEVRAVQSVARKVNSKSKRLLDAVGHRVQETARRTRNRENFANSKPEGHHLST